MPKYQTLYTKFTEDELKILAQLKRFFERLQCDSELRNTLNQGDISPGQLKRLKETGILFDLSGFPLSPEDQQNIMLYLFAVTKNAEEELDDEVKQFADKYPLLKLWSRYNEVIYEERSRYVNSHFDKTASSSAKFAAWRKRRITAAKSELGYFGMQISHPSFAYELCDGCSVGCWFCSFAANKLTGVLDYEAERDNIQCIIKHNIDIFGKATAGSALPYYSTEPHDNPHYIDFLRDFEELTGAVLCTSTAVCGDIGWLRELIKYYRNRDLRYGWPRLSILSLGMMDKVHDAFTPMELLDNELLIQAKDNTRPKVTGGRILEEHTGLRDKEDFSDKDSIDLVPQGSIACVSGFIINLVSRKITLCSPCYVCDEWPHGFRVYGEAFYNDASDFPDVINRLVEHSMFMSPPRDKILKFRDDIIFRPTEEGFDLATANQLHHFKGKNKYGPLGQLISESNHTYAQISEMLITKHKVNPIVMRTIVQQLFDEGFIDEIY